MYGHDSPSERKYNLGSVIEIEQDGSGTCP